MKQKLEFSHDGQTVSLETYEDFGSPGFVHIVFGGAFNVVLSEKEADLLGAAIIQWVHLPRIKVVE